MDPRTTLGEPQRKARLDRDVGVGTHEARSFVSRAGDTVKGGVKGGIDKVKHGVDDAVERARELHLRARAEEYGRAIDRHVRANPRMDLAIVAGVGVVLGVLFGTKLARWAILAAATYGITRIAQHDRGFRTLLGDAKSAVKASV